MKLLKLCCVVVVGLYVLVGCGTPSTESDISVQSVSSGEQASVGASSTMATIFGITKKAVEDKPGVTRVVLSLNKKASYATSREGKAIDRQCL